MKVHSHIRLAARSLQKRLTTCFAVGAIAMAGITTATAADCGCEQPICGCEQPACGCEQPACGWESTSYGCSTGGPADCSCSSCGPDRGPVYKSLDLFAGGIEKVLGLDKCGQCNSCDPCSSSSKPFRLKMPKLSMPHLKKPTCLLKLASMSKDVFGSNCDSCCDDGCDAAMIDELMIPVPAASQHHHHNHQHRQHALPESPIRPMPHSEMRMSEPRIESTPRRSSPIGSGATESRPSRIPIPQPTPMPEPNRPDETEPEGSLFDTLRDPFQDDDVRIHRPPYRSVRPSSYSDPNSSRNRHDELQPAPKRRSPATPSPNDQSSSRRAKSVR